MTDDDHTIDEGARSQPPEDGTEITKREAPASADGKAKPREPSQDRPASARGDKPPVKVEPAEPEYLSRGTLVGRYVVLDVLGEGGMGVVYNAFDPELDRKVAIKLMQIKSEGSSGGEQAWLLREAQALARLQHPNVVAVHDVGTLPGDRVFVAMELVDGVTLRAWLKDQPRTWREVLPVMRAAGAGLAAAHNAGLVHRDFKPDNVIVGNDGRVRVMDFGLARLRPDEQGLPPTRSSDLHLETKSPLSEKLTIAGTVVGTPAYMAPEIYQGHTADARADQFAFGVALYEALFRARPYDKKDLQPPLSAVRPKTPPDTGVPAPIQRVVLRAISVEHAQRYPTMDALLAELAFDPGVRRRKIAVGALVGVALLGAAGGVYALRANKGPAPCQGFDAKIAAVWNDPAKQKIHAAFSATKKSFAEPSFAGLSRVLDDYGKKWTATAVDSCQATRVRGEQTEEVLSLRQICLDERLEEMRALVSILGDADPIMVEKGDKMAAELDPVAACNNVAALREPGLPSPEIRPKVIELSRKVAAAKAQLIAGKYLPALTAVADSVKGAQEIGYEPLIAEAKVIDGAALLSTGNFADAAKSFGEATYAAMRGRRDDIAADAGLSAALVAADSLGRPDEAKIWLDHAMASAQRLGVDRLLERRRLEVEGLIAAYRGDLTSAIAMHEKALAAAELVYDKNDPMMISGEVNLGSTLSRAGAYAKAALHYERALAIREAGVGKDHPDIALLLSNLGACYHHMGEGKKARAAFERSIAIREGYYGKNSPILVPTFDNFAEFLRSEGDVAGALAYQERALQLARVLPGKTHPMYHQLTTDYCDTLIIAGRFAEAHTRFEEVFKLEADTHSAILPASQTSRAELGIAERKWAEAASFGEQAIAGYEAAGGKDTALLWRPLTAVARARIGLGHPRDARPLLERAVAIAKKGGIPAPDYQPTVDLLATLP